MLVGLSDSPDIVALVPTLGESPERVPTVAAAIAAQRTSRRIAMVVVINRPGRARLEGIPDEVEVVHAGLNLGWAGGLVLARTRATAPLLWLVQDDMAPEPDCVEALATALEADRSLGLVTPLVLDARGNVPRHSCGALLGADGEIARIYPERDTPLSQLGEIGPVDYVPSRGMLVRADDWDAVGGMDPRFYPVLWSDVDLCAGMRAQGLGFRLVLEARTRHLSNGSLPGGLGPFLHRRNRDLFASKWLPSAQLPALDPMRPASPAELDGELAADLPDRVRDAVAQAATDAFLHLSRVRTAELRAHQAEVTKLRRQVEANAAVDSSAPAT